MRAVWLLVAVAVLAVVGYQRGWLRGKPKLSAQATAALVSRTLRDVPDLSCAKGTAGWDYICSYQNPSDGREWKMGIALTRFAGRVTFRPGGSVPADYCAAPDPLGDKSDWRKALGDPKGWCLPGR